MRWKGESCFHHDCLGNPSELQLFANVTRWQFRHTRPGPARILRSRHTLSASHLRVQVLLVLRLVQVELWYPRLTGINTMASSTQVNGCLEDP